MIAASELLDSLPYYLWPFLRVSALFLVAPVFSATNIPVRVRVILGLAVAALLAPLVAGEVAVDTLSASWLLLAAREIIIGVMMGFVVQLAFAAVIVAGETLAMSMGLGFALSVDPQNGIQGPVVSQLNVILATLLFLAVDGHLLLLGALADSFQLLPLQPVGLEAGLFLDVFQLAAQVFATAVALALPALTAVLMTNIAFGVITRAAPQLNIFAVGFPVTIAVGLVFMMLALPAFLDRFGGALSLAIKQSVGLF